MPMRKAWSTTSAPKPSPPSSGSSTRCKARAEIGRTARTRTKCPKRPASSGAVAARQRSRSAEADVCRQKSVDSPPASPAPPHGRRRRRWPPSALAARSRARWCLKPAESAASWLLEPAGAIGCGSRRRQPREAAAYGDSRRSALHRQNEESGASKMPRTSAQGGKQTLLKVPAVRPQHDDRFSAV